jgi:hypothetical protein
MRRGSTHGPGPVIDITRLRAVADAEYGRGGMLRLFGLMGNPLFSGSGHAYSGLILGGICYSPISCC